MAVKLDLSGKRILVVGASSGIGRAVAEHAAAAGAHVALAARRVHRLEETATSLRAAGAHAVSISCDVSSEQSAHHGVEQAAAKLGGLDAFVYAPGVSPLRLLRDATQSEWRHVLDVNLIGASLVTAAAIPHLEASGGRAVYVGSYSTRQVLPGIGLYSVSKIALDGLIAAWRMEYPKLEFTRVLLGNTAGTEFAEGWGAEGIAAITKAWIERNLFPAATMMPLAHAAEAICSVLAIRGFVDDVGIMPRSTDGSL
jgi:NAD(P)-dependent dehydrogenase (short-subunit alcohol dehydrogenase family)